MLQLWGNKQQHMKEIIPQKLISSSPSNVCKLWMHHLHKFHHAVLDRRTHYFRCSVSGTVARKEGGGVISESVVVVIQVWSSPWGRRAVSALTQHMVPIIRSFFTAEDKSVFKYQKCWWQKQLCLCKNAQRSVKRPSLRNTFQLIHSIECWDFFFFFFLDKLDSLHQFVM